MPQDPECVFNLIVRCYPALHVESQKEAFILPGRDASDLDERLNDLRLLNFTVN